MKEKLQSAAVCRYPVEIHLEDIYTPHNATTSNIITETRMLSGGHITDLRRILVIANDLIVLFIYCKKIEDWFIWEDNGAISIIILDVVEEESRLLHPWC